MLNAVPISPCCVYCHVPVTALSTGSDTHLDTASLVSLLLSSVPALVLFSLVLFLALFTSPPGLAWLIGNPRVSSASCERVVVWTYVRRMKFSPAASVVRSRPAKLPCSLTFHWLDQPWIYVGSHTPSQRDRLCLPHFFYGTTSSGTTNQNKELEGSQQSASLRKICYSQRVCAGSRRTTGTYSFRWSVSGDV